ncbi:MAG: DUF429 domain-containing protein [Planctomycetes bacterium]|nr:DUF429 domain-containing protein [Planctomycetota bacterium]
MSAGAALGVDLALRDWRDCGLALVRWSGERWTGWRTRWARPRGAPSAEALTDYVDRLARAHAVRAVGLDGPLGWRDPATPSTAPGVGRRADFAVRAQAKVGVWGQSYPNTQLRWVELCVEVFSGLLAREGVVLANARPEELPPLPPGGYYLLETFPTATWRASGLTPLPSKRRCASVGVAPWAASLGATYRLPQRRACAHDDLQATVAALAAAAAAGGPARPCAHGVPARIVRPGGRPEHRVEGLIWTASPGG